MTSELTRQQRRALDRQKHHKHILPNSIYKTEKDLTTTHLVTGKPLFEYVRVTSVTHTEVIVVSPYGNKLTLNEKSFSSRYALVEAEESVKVWGTLLAEASKAKGSKVSVQEAYDKFLEQHPEMQEIVEAQQED